MCTGTRKIRTKIQLVRTNPGTQTPNQKKKKRNIGNKGEEKEPH
jgi:hypothetical protein